MKQQLITTEKATILVVDLPEGAINPYMKYNPYHSRWTIQYKLPDQPGFTCSGSSVLLFKDFGGRKNYPKQGELELLGKTFELSEHDWKRIVESSEYYDPHAQPYPIPCFKDYVDNVWKWEAYQSGLSLLTANKVFKENPFAPIPHRGLYIHEYEYLVDMDYWKEAEQHVFRNAYTLIKR